MPPAPSPSPPSPPPPGRQAAPGRVLAFDLGERRVGVACSDSARTVAAPREVLLRSGDPAADRARLALLVEEAGASLVVVGLPVTLAGSLGPAAEGALAEVAALRELLPVPVVTWDERLSTAEVNRRRLESAVARDAARRGGRGGRPGRARAGAPSGRRRPVLDDLAAAVILQGFLDAGGPVSSGG